MEFKDRLKELRKSKNITQAELGESVGVSTVTIRSYEAGRREPKYESLYMLAQFFNVSIEYLRGETDDADKPEDLIDENFKTTLNNICEKISSRTKQEKEIFYTLMLELQTTLDSGNLSLRKEAFECMIQIAKLVNECGK